MTKLIFLIRSIRNLKKILTTNYVEIWIKNSKNTITQYKYLHKTNLLYGTSSLLYYNKIKNLIREINPINIIDFGCGKGVLSDKIEQELKIKCTKYDPAIKKYNRIHTKHFDLLICTDVLEHVPIKKMEKLLKKITKLSDTCFFAISCRLATHILPNGENAHCTVFPKEWWKDYLNNYFNIITELEDEDPNTLVLIAKNKPRN